jgi:membrane protease YdiL (CAAX protease family)
MSTFFSQVILALESALMLGGCLLLWRDGLSPAARRQAQRQAAAMPAWPLGATGFILFLLLIVLCGCIVQGATALIVRFLSLSPTGAMIVVGGSLHAGMLLGIILFKLCFERHSARPAAAPSWPRRAAQGLATYMIALPLIAATAVIWQQLLQHCGVKLEEQELIGIFARSKSPRLIGAMIFLGCLVAPITEELIFRGGLFRYARTRTPRWIALLVPAVLFAALHQNLASFAPLMVLGIVFSLAYERTDDIVVPIIAHGLFNLNTFLLIFAGINF